MKAFIVILIFVLTGCSSVSPVTPYGKDTYIIGAQDGGMGTKTTAQLQVMAAQQANEYCAKQGKVMHVRNTKGQTGSSWEAASAGLIFSCIDESDPEYSRPSLRKEPDVLIEDRR
jgi:putative hemolysin